MAEEKRPAQEKIPNPSESGGENQGEEPARGLLDCLDQALEAHRRKGTRQRAYESTILAAKMKLVASDTETPDSPDDPDQNSEEKSPEH